LVLFRVRVRVTYTGILGIQIARVRVGSRDLPLGLELGVMLWIRDLSDAK